MCAAMWPLCRQRWHVHSSLLARLSTHAPSSTPTALTTGVMTSVMTHLPFWPPSTPTPASPSPLLQLRAPDMRHISLASNCASRAASRYVSMLALRASTKSSLSLPPASPLPSPLPSPPQSDNQGDSNGADSHTQSILGQLWFMARIAATAYVVQLYVANCTLSIGPSMQPTLNPRGDVVFTEAITPRLNLLRVGDVVVVTKPTDPSVSILKRIRAMAGDAIPYSEASVSSSSARVPADHVWLQGDNQAQSTDSRHYGPVPRALVRAKVWCRVWPIQHFVWFSPLASDRAPSHAPPPVPPA